MKKKPVDQITPSRPKTPNSILLVVVINIIIITVKTPNGQMFYCFFFVCIFNLFKIVISSNYDNY